MPSRVVVDDDEQIIADLQRDMRRLRSRLSTETPRGGHDAWTAAATPATTYQLTTIPVSGTCEFVINGHEQREGTDYSVDYDTGLVTVSAALASGDLLVARYLVTDWLVARSLPEDTGGYADNFNRTNATSLGSTSTGSLPWTAMSGTWGTDGTDAYIATFAVGPAANFAYIDVGQTDGIAQVKITSVDGSSATGVMTHMGPRTGSTTTANGYGVEYSPSGTSGIRQHTDAGVSTIGTGFTVAVGDTVGIRVAGGVAYGYVNGVLMESVTIIGEINQTATLVGLIGGKHTVAGTPTVSKFDDFAWTAA